MSTVQLRFSITAMICCCLLFTGLVEKAQAQTSLQGIRYSSQPGQTDQIELLLTGTSTIKDFTIKGKNPRLVFDLMDTKITRTVASATKVAGNLVREVRVAMHRGKQPKTRVVLDMVSLDDVHYSHHFAEKTGTLVINIFKGAQAAVPVKKTPQKTAASQPAPLKQRQQKKVTRAQGTQPPLPRQAPPNDSPSQAAPSEHPVLEKISYENSPGKGELVMFKLNGFHPPKVHGVEEGLPRAVCDFERATLGKDVKNQLDIKGKYVRTVRVGKHLKPPKIRVVVDLEPNNNYDLQQVFFKEDNLFVIIVNPID